LDREVQRLEYERKEVKKLVILRVAVDETMTIEGSVISSLGHRKE